MDWRPHITVDPNVCHGQACVAGTRILVSVVLDNLAAGVPEAEVIRSYPRLTPEAIQACIVYAAHLAREEDVELPGKRPMGLAKGDFVVPDGFDDALPEDVL